MVWLNVYPTNISDNCVHTHIFTKSALGISLTQIWDEQPRKPIPSPNPSLPYYTGIWWICSVLFVPEVGHFQQQRVHY